MNSVNEKEKKLISALSELKNLKLHNPEIKQHLEALSTQKNQLEIEIDLKKHRHHPNRRLESNHQKAKTIDSKSIQN